MLVSSFLLPTQKKICSIKLESGIYDHSHHNPPPFFKAGLPKPMHPRPPITDRRAFQIVHIQNISALLHERRPNFIPYIYRPARRVPIPSFQAPLVRAADLASEDAELMRRELASPNEADGAGERDGGVVAIRGIEGG